MTGFDLTILANAQSQARQKLETYINDNLANPTVGDVIGRRKAIIEDYPLLPAGLPNGDSLGKKKQLSSRSNVDLEQIRNGFFPHVEKNHFIKISAILRLMSANPKFGNLLNI